jgi:hypothetical protein
MPELAPVTTTTLDDMKQIYNKGNIVAEPTRKGLYTDENPMALHCLIV